MHKVNLLTLSHALYNKSWKHLTPKERKTVMSERDKLQKAADYCVS